MLNRLYIIVGLVAILLLAAAFVVPSFIPWGQYRDRLAAIAGEVLGTPVRIEGDVSFSLLPQPRLEFSDVSAGPPDAPNLTVDRVEADFSLVDFLRDRYNVTRLQLDRPTVEIKVGSDGTVDTGIALARAVNSNISVASAILSDGTLRVSDSRSGDDYVASDIAGEVKLTALRGPFSFQGTGNFGEASYALRVTTGELDADGVAQISASLRPAAAGAGFTLGAEGVLTPGLAPNFSGNLTYRLPPPKPVEPGTEDVGQGDLVMTARVEASPAKVLFSDYVVIPDENRAATRLLGAADVTLGTDMSFNAVISGGLLALPPRDATAEQGPQPYELVRLLRELPLPASPGLPGTIGIDIAELNLRGIALRNVRIDADARSDGWDLRQLTGTLPGDSRLTLEGEVTPRDGRPEFAGTMELDSKRLDALSTAWRKPAPGNPLFGMSGRLEARLDLVGETLSISNGRLTLAGETRSFDAQIGLGAARDIHLNADLGNLDPARSAALLALLPDGGDVAFAATFPKGEFDLRAESMSLDGLDGRSLAAAGSWDGGVLVVDNVSANDLGGVRFAASLTAFGTLAKPELSGSASLAVASPEAPALRRFYDAIRLSPSMEEFLAGSLPAELKLRLDAPNGGGAQSLGLSGRLGTAELTADAQLAAGFLRALGDSVTLRLDMKSPDPAAMTRQLGLGETSLFAEDQPMHLVARLEGNVANSLEATVRLEGSGDSIGFAGNVVVTDPDAFSGKGNLKLALSEPTALAARLGVGGIALPPLEASATVDFDGATTIRLEDIAGTSGGEAFSGRLALAASGGAPALSGEIAAGRLDVGGLVGTLLGPAALLNSGSGPWPDGPLATGDAPRTLAGRVKLTAAAVTAAGSDLLTDVGFDLDWDATASRLRNFAGKIGGGTIGLELQLCCAGPLPDKQLSGRVTVAGVALDALLPAPVAAAFDGTLEVAGRFDATAGSVAGLFAAMTGEGTYGVKSLRIEGLDPAALARVGDVDGILEMQPDQVVAEIESQLGKGSFESPQLSGSFTIAGGTLRSPNLPVEGPRGQLFGSGTLRLSDLGLGGSYTVSATSVTPAAVAATSTAKVTADIGGTLLMPERSFDVSALVDTIMVKAYEAEVARLEKLRAEEEARAKAAAEEKARFEAAEAARRAAEEDAAREAAEEKAAAEAEARRQEEIRRLLQEELSKPMDIGLGN